MMRDEIIGVIAQGLAITWSYKKHMEKHKYNDDAFFLLFAYDKGMLSDCASRLQFDQLHNDKYSLNCNVK